MTFPSVSGSPGGDGPDPGFWEKLLRDLERRAYRRLSELNFPHEKAKELAEEAAAIAVACTQSKVAEGKCSSSPEDKRRFAFGVLELEILVINRRERGGRGGGGPPLPPDLPGNDLRPSDIAEQNELERVMRECRKGLSAIENEIVEMKIDQGMTFQQTADQLNLPLHKVYRHWTSALNTLRNCLQTKGYP